jgi:hypothetical protein
MLGATEKVERNKIEFHKVVAYNSEEREILKKERL